MANYQLTDMSTTYGAGRPQYWVEGEEGYEATFIFVSEDGQPRTVKHAQMKVMRFTESRYVAAVLRELADKIEQIGVSDG